MRLALIQNHCSPDLDENLERALNSMEQAKESGADMVVFPELAIDRFFPQHEEWNAREIAEPIPGPTTRAIGAKAKSLSLVTVFNLYMKRPWPDGTSTAPPCSTPTGCCWA